MAFTYKIDGTIFVQMPLVLGQLRQLLAVLKNVEIPAVADALGLIQAVGDRLPEALAVVLTERGQSPRDKDLAALADRLAFSVTPETTLQVVEDFFDCNPVSSLLERLAGVMANATRNLAPIGSTTLSSSSPQETSPGETRSSGDADGTNVNPG